MVGYLFSGVCVAVANVVKRDMEALRRNVGTGKSKGILASGFKHSLIFIICFD
jgi:hypothetical protein